MCNVFKKQKIVNFIFVCLQPFTLALDFENPENFSKYKVYEPAIELSEKAVSKVYAPIWNWAPLDTTSSGFKILYKTVIKFNETCLNYKPNSLVVRNSQNGLISNIWISHLLSVSPNIHKLGFKNFTFKSFKHFDEQKVKLSQELMNNNISSNRFIETLVIENCKIDNTVENIQCLNDLPMGLKKIKFKCFLDQDNLSVVRFLNLLQGSNTIKALDFENVEMTFQVSFNLSQIISSLLNLKTITFENCKLSVENFMMILKGVEDNPQITLLNKKIILSEPFLIDENLEPDQKIEILIKPHIDRKHLKKFSDSKSVINKLKSINHINYYTPKSKL